MSQFPMEFACYNCGSKERITQIAYDEELPEGEESKFARLESSVIPLRQATGLTVPTLLIHWDICAKCGTRYCAKAEKVNAPVITKPIQSSQLPPGLGQGPSGPGFPFLRG